MIEQFIARLALAIQAVLLIRLWRNGLWKHLPVFYAYTAAVVGAEILRIYCYSFYPSAYAHVYWYSEIPLVVIGYALIIEIYDRCLEQYPSLVRFSQVFLVAIFVIIAGVVLAKGLGVSAWPVRHVPESMESELRVAQAALLLVLVGLLARYQIKVDRNVKGLVAGYGVFVAFRTIQVSIYAITGHKSEIARELQPLVYLVSIAVWLVFLWSRDTALVVKPEQTVSPNQAWLSHAARLTLARARAYLARGVRP
jgi:uncharacterized membrane protein YczE